VSATTPRGDEFPQWKPIDLPGCTGSDIRNIDGGQVPVAPRRIVHISRERMEMVRTAGQETKLYRPGNWDVLGVAKCRGAGYSKRRARRSASWLGWYVIFVWTLRQLLESSTWTGNRPPRGAER